MSNTRIVCTASGGGRTVLNLLDRIERGSLDASIELVLVDRECGAIECCAARGLTVELMPWTRATTSDEIEMLRELGYLPSGQQFTRSL